MRSSLAGVPMKRLLSLPLACSSARVLALAVAVSLGACAGSTPSPFDAPPPPATDDVGLPDEILREEILRRGTADPSAHALISRLRPIWLMARGQTSFLSPSSTDPVVYIDGFRHGALTMLHQIPAHQIKRMEFIGTADATTRWGTGHRAGVINVVTGR